MPLDRAGRIARKHFPGGCHLDFDDEGYHQSCPAALAHSRVGMSPGTIIREAHRSICKLDPEDCEHITGHLYDGVRCVRVITDAELLEVSLVARPNQPDARIQRISVATDEIRRRLGPHFRRGMPVLCDKCLSDCGGVSDSFAKER